MHAKALRASPVPAENFGWQIAGETIFLGRSPDLAEGEDLRAFQVRRREQGAQPPTMNGAVAALRFFFHDDWTYDPCFAKAHAAGRRNLGSPRKQMKGPPADCVDGAVRALPRRSSVWSAAVQADNVCNIIVASHRGMPALGLSPDPASAFNLTSAAPQDSCRTCRSAEGFRVVTIATPHS
jgi:hypothetical protein